MGIAIKSIAFRAGIKDKEVTSNIKKSKCMKIQIKKKGRKIAELKLEK